MRLSEIRRLVATNLPALQCSMENHANDGGLKVLCGVRSALAAVHSLKAISSLAERVGRLEAMADVSSLHTDAKSAVPAASAINFTSELANLRSECNTILHLAEDVLPPMGDDVFCVKLPTDIDLAGLSRIAREFSDLFDLLATNRNIDGEIRFVGVESGTSWLYVKLAGAIAGIFNVLTDVIYNAFEKYVALQKSQQILRQLEVKTGIIEDVGKLMRTYLHKEMQRISVESNLELDPEDVEKHVRCLAKIMAELEQGLEIHPPLPVGQDADERIALLEREVKELKLLNSPDENHSG